MQTRRWKRFRPWAVVLIVLSLLGTLALAVEESVTVHARWMVLPYQTLRVLGSDERLSSMAYEIPIPSSGDRARGYVEDSDVVRLQVVSNGTWKVLVWTEQLNLGGRPVSDVLIRDQAGTFFAVGGQPHVLARGENGTFEIGVDYRVLLDSNSDAPTGSLDLIYLIMSD